MNKTNLLCLLTIGLILVPEMAFASKAIEEFSTPFETIVGTITGPVGRWVSIAAFATSGIAFISKKESLDGGFKILLNVVFAISCIAFAGTIVNSVFTFQGAVL